jgi:hypothetical protein
MRYSIGLIPHHIDIYYAQNAEEADQSALAKQQVFLEEIRNYANAFTALVSSAYYDGIINTVDEVSEFNKQIEHHTLFLEEKLITEINQNLKTAHSVYFELLNKLHKDITETRKNIIGINNKKIHDYASNKKFIEGLLTYCRGKAISYFTQIINPFRGRLYGDGEGEGDCFGHIYAWSHDRDIQSALIKQQQQSKKYKPWFSDNIFDDYVSVNSYEHIISEFNFKQNQSYSFSLCSEAGFSHLCGIRKCNGIDEYEFHDPNFGIFRFSSKQDLALFGKIIIMYYSATGTVFKFFKVYSIDDKNYASDIKNAIENKLNHSLSSILANLFPIVSPKLLLDTYFLQELCKLFEQAQVDEHSKIMLHFFKKILALKNQDRLYFQAVTLFYFIEFHFDAKNNKFSTAPLPCEIKFDPYIDDPKGLYNSMIDAYIPDEFIKLKNYLKNHGNKLKATYFMYIYIKITNTKAQCENSLMAYAALIDTQENNRKLTVNENKLHEIINIITKLNITSDKIDALSSGDKNKLINILTSNENQESSAREFFNNLESPKEDIHDIINQIKTEHNNDLLLNIFTKLFCALDNTAWDDIPRKIRLLDALLHPKMLHYFSYNDIEKLYISISSFSCKIKLQFTNSEGTVYSWRYFNGKNRWAEIIQILKKQILEIKLKDSSKIPPSTIVDILEIGEKLSAEVFKENNPAKLYSHYDTFWSEKNTSDNLFVAHHGLH